MCEREYKNKEWLKEQLDIHKTPNAVALATGYSRTSITRYATKYNLYTVKYNRDKTNHVNETYFANIDTAKKAYFLGFIMADGNMYLNSNGKYQFSIKIKNTDIDILKQFADEIEFPEDKIVEREETRKGTITKCAELKIYNQEFCSYLLDLGIVPRKTGKEVFPELKEEFKKDFIRGYIDGDGWIGKEEIQIGLCSASYNLIKNIRDYIKDALDIELNIYNQVDTYVLKTYRKKSVYQILKHFYYDNCIALNRKYTLAINKRNEIIEDLIGSL